MSSSIAAPPDIPGTLHVANVIEKKNSTHLQESEFGLLESKWHRYTSKFNGTEFPEAIMDKPSRFYIITAYLSYVILIGIGQLRDFFGKFSGMTSFQHLHEQEGYAPLNEDFDNFYVRRLKCRVDDCCNRPITGVPGRYVTLLDRVSYDGNRTFKLSGTKTETLNMGSYNYLGFVQSEGPCADEVERAICESGVAMCSSRADAGTTPLHFEVEDLLAKFLGKEAAVVFSMGFVTNSSSFPALVGKHSLIVSDELNHSSIRTGARMSGASVCAFKHNNMKDLEKKLRQAIIEGQPLTHRPWKKILVVVEGLYSMEGTICNLPEILKLKKKFKFYLFVDEAHSVGALGPNGRGVCDYFGIDPSEVDILMGTLTKSFGANGGYLAGSKKVVDKVRATNSAMKLAESSMPPVLSQIATSVRLLQGDICKGQGAERLERLAFNSRYLRLGLKRLGFLIYGHDDSPIIPMLMYNPAKIPAFSRELLARRISIVIAGFPAVPVILSRARFCVSAAHTKADLDWMLTACDEVGDLLQLKISTGAAGGTVPMEWNGWIPHVPKSCEEPPAGKGRDDDGDGTTVSDRSSSILVGHGPGTLRNVRSCEGVDRALANQPHGVETHETGQLWSGERESDPSDNTAKAISKTGGGFDPTVSATTIKVASSTTKYQNNFQGPLACGDIQFPDRGGVRERRCRACMDVGFSGCRCVQGYGKPGVVAPETREEYFLRGKPGRQLSLLSVVLIFNSVYQMFPFFRSNPETCQPPRWSLEDVLRRGEYDSKRRLF